MATISLCMIVKNEEDVLRRCLESAKDIVDEIIIVDTGSTDKTKEIAKDFNSKIYDFEWIDDFSAARNNSFSKATMDYILWLDADDVILEEDREKLKKLKEEIDSSVDVVMMKYNYAFDEFDNVSLCFYRERLVKKNKQPEWQDPIHEFIKIDGNTINSDICITHKRIHESSDRNLKIFEKMISENKTLSPRNIFYYAKELYYHNRYNEAIEYFNKFIATKKGWTEDIINAFYTLSICYDNINDKELMLKSLLQSFEYDIPRAEICCQIGNYYMNESKYINAIFWYEIATNLKKQNDNFGFILEDYWGYIPNIQLCVCYYKIGRIEESIKYNDRASIYKPKSQTILSNRVFFDSIQKNKDNGNFKPLRIVQVAPDYYAVPPENYGGIERVIYDLTEELVKMGHEVFLFAPKGSHSSANIINYEHYGVNPNEITSFVKSHLPENIDIIHDHTHSSVIGRENLGIPTVCTIHTPVNNIVKYPIYVSKSALDLHTGGNGYFVHNGINFEEFEFSDEKENYLLYMGMLAWYKGIIHVLEVAEKTGQKLIIAGPIYDMDYYKREIEPRIINNPNIEYIGSVGGAQKQNLLKHAKCVLLPTICQEPFGLIMVESMACGTPILALSNGAIPEVLKGFPELICDSIDEMVDKVLKLLPKDYKELHDYAIENFTRSKMAKEYTKIYNEVIYKEKNNAN